VTAPVGAALRALAVKRAQVEVKRAAIKSAIVPERFRQLNDLINQEQDDDLQLRALRHSGAELK
jgi:DNA-binding transcriptional regulator YdaS (Cro superfamily)